MFRTIFLGTGARAAVALLLAGLAARQTPPASAKAGIPLEEFARLHGLVKPQPGEARWAAIPWLTSLAEARQRSVAEDKPLFVWRAGGGEVLGSA
jgi:hypothetical protein